VSLPNDDSSQNEQQGRPRADSMSSLYQHPAQARAQVIETAAEFGYGRHEDSPSASPSFAKSPPAHGHGRAHSASRRHNSRNSGQSISRPRGKRNGSGNAVPPLPGHGEVLAPHAEEGNSTTASSSSATAVGESRASSPVVDSHEGHDHSHSPEQGKGTLAQDASEAEHGHSHDEEDGHGHGGGGGHNHGSMNMRGVFLHVLGDALVQPTADCARC
jgi:zinc transporter 1